jgi:hypothetical protein
MHLHIVHRLPAVAAAALIAVLLSGMQITANLVASNQTAAQFNGAVEEAASQQYHGRTVFRDRRLQQAYRAKVANRLKAIAIERRRLRREMRNIQEAEVLYGSAEEDAVELSQNLGKQRFSQRFSLNKASRLLRRLLFRAGLNTRDATKRSAVSAAENVLELRNQDMRLLKRYNFTQAGYVRNDERVRASTEQLRAAREMMR